MLQWLYAERLYRPAWSTPAGLLPQIETLLEAIRGAETEGLQPADYFLSTIEPMLARIRQQTATMAEPAPEQLAELDLLLSAALVSYGADLLFGRHRPGSQEGEVSLHTEADLRGILQPALDTGQIHAALHQLLPLHAGYGRLRQALAHYRRLAAQGGWPSIAPGPVLRLGDRDPRLVALRQRLRITGELGPASPVAVNLFDEAVEQAVRLFQERHGLDVDGVVGPTTLAALNVPVAARVRQIAVNMDRWRWLPQHLGARYLVVNIANFTLDVMEQEQVVMTMRVVVGTPQQRTPIFSDTMTHLILNPYWRVPPSIARREILPRLRREPGYLATQNIKLLRGQGAEAREVNPHSIDWSAVTAQNFNYSLRQDPGPDNALGRVKFMFPNVFDVYMHDTPQRRLFARPVRAFSHGCIRLEQPIALAEYLLRGQPSWSREKILAAIARGAESYVRLPEVLPVHLVYWTAWVSENGVLHFRPDIYGYDTRQEASPSVASPRQADFQS
jgi:murein L,D-transpeptidase YcbB/YkuD